MGTIKTTNIEPIANNGTVTLGSSGDTFTVPSGVTVNMSSATQTGVGGVNTPAFSVYNSSTQSIASATNTQLLFNTELYDTDSAFASNRFTVPSGKGGKYEIGVQVRRSNFAGARAFITLMRNGSDEFGYFEIAGTSDSYNTIGGVVVKEFSAGDYVDAFFYHNDSGSRSLTGGAQFQRFFGFKIIE